MRHTDISDRLPTPILLRVLFLGTVLGSATSGLRILQSHIGRLREEEEAKKAAEEALLAPPMEDGKSTSQDAEHALVDRPLEPGAPVVDIETAAVAQTSSSWRQWLGL